MPTWDWEPAWEPVKPSNSPPANTIYWQPGLLFHIQPRRQRHEKRQHIAFNLHHYYYYYFLLCPAMHMKTRPGNPKPSPRIQRDSGGREDNIWPCPRFGNLPKVWGRNPTPPHTWHVRTPEISWLNPELYAQRRAALWLQSLESLYLHGISQPPTRSGDLSLCREKVRTWSVM